MKVNTDKPEKDSLNINSRFLGMEAAALQLIEGDKGIWKGGAIR